MRALKKILENDYILERDVEYTLQEIEERVQEFIDISNIHRPIVKFTIAAIKEDDSYSDYTWAKMTVYFYAEETEEEEAERLRIEKMRIDIAKKRKKELESDEYKEYLKLRNKFG